jgi:MFS family permease
VIGPLVAGGLIASIGVKWCFAINAVSYVAVLVMLAVMDAATFRARRPAGGGGSIRDGLRYVASSHELLLSLSMVAVISTFAWNWETLLALHASETLDGGARLYTVMFAVLSVGTFIGALVNASRRSVTLRHLPATALGLGIAMAGVAVAPTMWLTLALLVATGVGASMFNTASNAVVQIAARGEYQGRVMAVFSALFVGTKGIGGAIAGALAQGFGSRVAIAVSAGGCLTAAAGGAAFSRPRPDVVTPPEPALPS